MTARFLIDGSKVLQTGLFKNKESTELLNSRDGLIVTKYRSNGKEKRKGQQQSYITHLYSEIYFVYFVKYMAVHPPNSSREFGVP